MKQKTSDNEANAALANQVVIEAVEDENSTFESISASLVEIRKLEGVLGYILRSSTSAVIDLGESDKITQNAILTSQIQLSSQEIIGQFNLGRMENVLVEGKNVKVLCMSIGENYVSVFMEKDAAHQSIMKRFLM